MEKNRETCRHWKTTLDEDGILWLGLDRADSSVNTLSREVLDELRVILDDLVRQQPTGLVLRSEKKGGFIAGADVKQFSALTDVAQARMHVDRVHELFDRFERLPFPTVSLIRGFCLGGGLELALACRTRIAVDIPGTLLGLPEVRLNLHPGFGGTVRLIRLVGPLRALDMMLSGRSVNARRALEIGLVDAVVPEHQKTRAVRMAILHAPVRRKSHFLNLAFRLRFLRTLLVKYLRRNVAKRADKDHYPAPYALLDLWECFGGDWGSMDREEARSVANLVAGDTAQNLVRVFVLRERLQDLGRSASGTSSSVHVIGGGIMGGDIAAWCALQGHRVSIQDVDKERLAGAVERAALLFHKNLREPRLVQEALDRFISDLSGDGLSGADVVIEAIFEDAAAKQSLFRQIEPRMRRDALLATNTSSIPLEELAGSLLHPDRFVGLHFFNPVPKMLLVEVVRGPVVDAGLFDAAVRFVGAIRKLPLPVASSPGFLINRILTPYLLEAVLMEEEGIPPFEIDRAALAFGMPIGPLLLADAIGLDICLSVGRNLSRHLQYEVPKRLESLVAAGRLGKKNGRGFYAYNKGQPAAPGRKSRGSPENTLTDRLVLRMLNESIACRREMITSDDDLLDAGVIFGAGFAPFRGGPLHYIRKRGVTPIRAKLKTLEAQYGERFAADQGWDAFNEDLLRAPGLPGDA
jgi:3-hydroxyacyl-CoA dehydrogenase / enoyl-CoA hydratase / 3-hydroxybutyryl-CoA epimerase